VYASVPNAVLGASTPVATTGATYALTDEIVLERARFNEML
jgi:hypothetical protein